MCHSREVGVATGQVVEETDNGGYSRRRNDFTSKILVDSTNQHVLQISDEAVGCSMPDPVLMGVDSPAILTTDLAVRVSRGIWDQRSLFGRSGDRRRTAPMAHSRKGSDRGREHEESRHEELHGRSNEARSRMRKNKIAKASLQCQPSKRTSWRRHSKCNLTDHVRLFARES